MGLDEGQLTTLRMGAYLHDLGKVRVPHEILNKPGPLDAEEFEIIKQHPMWGIELLAHRRVPLGHQADHPVAPRAVRRQRVSRPAAG